jgi:uncharacterized protein (DUF2164 family)
MDKISEANVMLNLRNAEYFDDVKKALGHYFWNIGYMDVAAFLRY